MRFMEQDTIHIYLKSIEMGPEVTDMDQREVSVRFALIGEDRKEIGELSENFSVEHKTADNLDWQSLRERGSERLARHLAGLIVEVMPKATGVEVAIFPGPEKIAVGQTAPRS